MDVKNISPYIVLFIIVGSFLGWKIAKAIKKRYVQEINTIIDERLRSFEKDIVERYDMKEWDPVYVVDEHDDINNFEKSDELYVEGKRATITEPKNTQ